MLLNFDWNYVTGIIRFSYSLRYQLMKKNISVSCLCQGSDFTKPEIVKDTEEKLGRLGMQMSLYVKKVGELAIRKTLRVRMMIVPGTLAKITSVIIRILPRRLVAAIYTKVGNK